jgi:hypothetical protein
MTVPASDNAEGVDLKNIRSRNITNTTYVVIDCYAGVKRRQSISYLAVQGHC